MDIQDQNAVEKDMGIRSRPSTEMNSEAQIKDAKVPFGSRTNPRAKNKKEYTAACRVQRPNRVR